ncbi:hypothetical protein VKT23_013407 [Stygiomarasmius scandens]|uniref:Uncharacterized protein n=1 Tax=Marasmiellus scandens TaxID=2682957 RepID=A0ABR1J399_9AGAR
MASSGNSSQTGAAAVAGSLVGKSLKRARKSIAVPASKSKTKTRTRRTRKPWNAGKSTGGEAPRLPMGAGLPSDGKYGEDRADDSLDIEMEGFSDSEGLHSGSSTLDYTVEFARFTPGVQDAATVLPTHKRRSAEYVAKLACLEVDSSYAKNGMPESHQFECPTCTKSDHYMRKLPGGVVYSGFFDGNGAPIDVIQNIRWTEFRFFRAPKLPTLGLLQIELDEEMLEQQVPFRKTKIVAEGYASGVVCVTDIITHGLKAPDIPLDNVASPRPLVIQVVKFNLLTEAGSVSYTNRIHQAMNAFRSEVFNNIICFPTANLQPRLVADFAARYVEQAIYRQNPTDAALHLILEGDSRLGIHSKILRLGHSVNDKVAVVGFFCSMTRRKPVLNVFSDGRIRRAVDALRRRVSDPDSADTLGWTLGVDLEHLARVIRKAIEHKVVLPIVASEYFGLTVPERHSLLATWRPAARQVYAQNVAFVDQNGVSLIWYLPDLIPTGIKNKLFRKTALIQPKIVTLALEPTPPGLVAIPHSASDHGRFLDNYMRPVVFPGICEFSYGLRHEQSDIIVEPSASLRHPPELKPETEEWLFQISPLQIAVSLVLSVIHPDLFDGGKAVLDQCCLSTSLHTSEWAKNWNSVFTSLTVSAGRVTEPHVHNKGASNYFDAFVGLGTASKPKMILQELNACFSYKAGAGMFFAGNSWTHEVPDWGRGERVSYTSCILPEMIEFGTERIDSYGLKITL